MSKMHVKPKKNLTAIKQFVWKQTLYLATHSIEYLLPWYFTKGCAITRHIFNAKNKDFSIKQCGLFIHCSQFYCKHMGQTRQEVKRQKKQIFFSTSACFADMKLFILRLQMVFIQQIHRRHQFKTFVRSVALVELGYSSHLNLAIFQKNI